MIVSLPVCTIFKAIRKPGKDGPAALAFFDPGPPLRDFTKHIAAKAKPPVSISPSLDSGAEGFAKPMSSEPAPSHRPWIGVLGATPGRRASPYHVVHKFNLCKQDSFCEMKDRSCRTRSSARKTTLQYQNELRKGTNGGMLQVDRVRACRS